MAPLSSLCYRSEVQRSQERMWVNCYFPFGVWLLVIQEVRVSLKYYRRGFMYLPLLHVL